MDHSTAKGFPSTRQSVLTGIRSGDPATRDRALDLLIRAYWRPVYGYLRLKWRLDRDDASDATQEFFLRAMEQSYFDRFDPSRARFRTFLRTCVDRFVSKERRAAGRLKREGSVRVLSLDFWDAEPSVAELATSGDLDVDAWFQREWVRSIFTQAVDALREHCRQDGNELPFRLFERYDIEAAARQTPLRYRDLAVEFELPVTQVTNYLSVARREFRRLVLEQLRALTASDEEFRAEAEELLGLRQA